jgi:hypothetical protein
MDDEEMILMKKLNSAGWLLFFVITILTLGLLAPECTIAGRREGTGGVTTWTKTTPAINETHLFDGYVNRKGDPVGFHSRPGGRDPGMARVTSVIDPPNKAGVYNARIEILASGRRWLSKQSTFFPDKMTRGQVIQAVLHAYQHKTSGNSVKFSGPSGKGFTIQGYLLTDGRINTAFPVYRRDQ